MKTRILPFILLSFLFANNSTKAQYVSLPDTNFRNVLMGLYPTCFNAAKQMDTTCGDFVNVSSLKCRSKNISNIEGVKYFKNLTELACDSNNLTAIPQLPTIINIVSFSHNNIDSLSDSLFLLPNLYNIDVSYNNIKKLPQVTIPSYNVNLNCSHNQISEIPPILSSSYIMSFDCSYNNISGDITLPINASSIYCSHNNIKSINDGLSSTTFLDKFLIKILHQLIVPILIYLV